MKKINVNKIIEDENMFAEIVITEDETLFKYLTINNWDYLKIPNDIKIIGRGIFVAKDLKTIKKIYKENGFEKDDYDYFMEMINQIEVDKLFIPKSVEKISETAFMMAEIHEFVIDESNENLHLINGLLLNKEKNVLLACSGAFDNNKPWPDTIKRIGENAFSSFPFENDVELIIPEGIKEIGADAFNYAYGIKTIYLPKSIELIEERGLELDDDEFPSIYVYKNSFAHKYLLENKIDYQLIEE